MKIQQAVPQDLVEVLYLMKVCVSDMNEQGQKHWNNAYPGQEFLITAIEKGSLYTYKDLEVVKGMVVLSDEEPEEYKNIEWVGKGDKVLFIRFLAVHPTWQGKGIAKRLVEYAEGYSKDHGYTSIRVDIYSGVPGAEKLCIDLGFNQTGQFHSPFQQTPYFAFEKSL
jgi:GNAT superfamily N-acetyltransferase